MLMLVFLITYASYAEDAGDWRTQPVITQVYEQAPGKVYLEWNGKASAYHIFLDGKWLCSTDVPSALIDINRGAHNIKVVPAGKEGATDISLGVNYVVAIDFALPGTTPGTPSAPLSIDYIPNSILGAELAAPSAQMSSDNTVLLSWNDRFGADEYLISVKEGSKTDFIRFFPKDETRNEQISIAGSVVTVRLDPAYLRENGYAQIELGKKYAFTVLLRKHATSMLTGETIPSVIHETKASQELLFTPYGIWSVAPVITQAEQIGEGQVRLQWEHERGVNTSCEYDVILASKVLMVKTADTLVATTSDQEIILNDLADGSYSFSIVPRLDASKGAASAEASVTVKNTWVEEPKLTLAQVDNHQVKLEWPAALGVESYHIRVLAGDSTSLLQFVDMDYKEYRQFDVPVTGELLSITFSYEDRIDPEKGIKLKFEIRGIKHANNGDELTTRTGSQTITIKP